MMSIVDDIRTKFASDTIEFSRHALDQSVQRGVSVGEIREAIENAEMIEDYPDDKYGPSCSLLGFTRQGRALHVQVSYPSRPLVKIVTLYEPDPELWVDHRRRKTR